MTTQSRQRDFVIRERKEFERYMTQFSERDLRMSDNDYNEYGNTYVESSWKSWLARAGLYTCPIATIKPSNWHKIGYYHKAKTADECEFYFLDSVDGDCPDCHPCYADTAALEKPGWPAVPSTPLTLQEIDELIAANQVEGYPQCRAIARAIEAAHGIKETS